MPVLSKEFLDTQIIIECNSILNANVTLSKHTIWTIIHNSNDLNKLGNIKVIICEFFVLGFILPPPKSKYLILNSTLFYEDPVLKWSAIKRVSTYFSTTKKCMLCFQEKLEIIKSPESRRIIE